jgi:hypothetical protein
MIRLTTAIAIGAVTLTAAAFAPAALAKGGPALQLPGGGGDLGRAGGGGGGGGDLDRAGGGGGGGGGHNPAPAPSPTPAPAPAVDLAGTWSGVETTPFGTSPPLLSLTQSGGRYSGSYTRIVAGDSPVFKLSSASITGNRVTLVFTQGGNPSTHPNIGLSATLSADGRTLTGTFGLTPVTLTR